MISSAHRRSVPLSLIAAMADDRIIGAGGRLPWHLPADLKHFRRVTLGHHVIMGRKTWASLPKPLVQRVNVVVTHSPDTVVAASELSQRDAHEPRVVVVSSLAAALEMARVAEDPEPFVIGGQSLYQQALGLAHTIYLTRVYGAFEGDVRFPELDASLWRTADCEHHAPGPEFDYPFAFCRLVRREGGPR